MCNCLQICSVWTGADIELMRIVWPVNGSWAKWGCTGWWRWLASLDVPAKITRAHINSNEHVTTSDLHSNNYIPLEQIFWLAIWIITFCIFIKQFNKTSTIISMTFVFTAWVALTMDFILTIFIRVPLSVSLGNSMSRYSAMAVEHTVHIGGGGTGQ